MSSEELTINVSDSDMININVNLSGGEVLVAPISAFGISEELTVDMSNNDVVNVNEGEFLVSSSPVISAL